MRGTGTTTQQLKSAPACSLFIWCTRELSYPRFILRKLGRNDVEIIGVNVLDDERITHGTYTAIIVDHAVASSAERHRKLCLMMQQNVCKAEQTDDFKQRTMVQINIANHFSREEEKQASLKIMAQGDAR